MNSLFSPATIDRWYSIVEVWIRTQIISWEVLAQVVTLLLISLIGTLIGRPLVKVLRRYIEGKGSQNQLIQSFLNRIGKLVPFVVRIVLIWIAIQVFRRIDTSSFFMILVLNLWIAWVVVQLATSVILDKIWSRFVALIVWILAALNIAGLFGSVISFLDTTGFSIGKIEMSLLSLIKAIILAVVLLSIVSWLNRQFEKRLGYVSGLDSSTRLMMTKITHVAMIVIAGIIVLNTVGLDFSSFALFSGAVGVGIGFGLQKVVGNYVSGLILLSDKSVKPGDVIQLADAFGWVRFMGGRYVSVVTRDEKEYLIPNEDLITQQVINWSYTNNKIRLKVEFGVAYKSDPHQVVSLVLNAIGEIDRILKNPVPACLLRGFGDNSIDFELRYWIEDPQKGVANINSIVLLKIWDVFKQHTIEIPFPQRDVYLKS